MFCLRLRNLPPKCRSIDVKKIFDRHVESLELKGQEGRVCFKGSESEAVQFHDTWNGAALGNRRVEMMIDWQDKQI